MIIVKLKLNVYNIQLNIFSAWTLKLFLPLYYKIVSKNIKLHTLFFLNFIYLNKNTQIKLWSSNGGLTEIYHVVFNDRFAELDLNLIAFIFKHRFFNFKC